MGNVCMKAGLYTCTHQGLASRHLNKAKSAREDIILRACIYTDGTRLDLIQTAENNCALKAVTLLFRVNNDYSFPDCKSELTCCDTNGTRAPKQVFNLPAVSLSIVFLPACLYTYFTFCNYLFFFLFSSFKYVFNHYLCTSHLSFIRDLKVSHFIEHACYVFHPWIKNNIPVVALPSQISERVYA